MTGTLYPDIIHGDCLEVMRTMPDQSIDLIMTSPPYAEQRKRQYGGIPESEYVEWWMERATQMRRILKPSGSLVVNIKEHRKERSRVIYVYETVIAMVRAGWLWTEDYSWVKTKAMPHEYEGNHFRDAWEHCYHFTLQADIKWNRDRVRVLGKSTIRHKLRDKVKHSGTGSNFRRNEVNFTRPDVLPDNVLVGAMSMCSAHPAAYPEWLPLWFIKLLTDEGDTVLDPFAGSGTTLQAARRLRRRAIGIEINEKYAYVQPPEGQELLPHV